MPEREYTDYEEWLRSGGDPTYGQGVSETQYPTPYPGWPEGVPTPEPVPTIPTTPPPTQTGGRPLTPQERAEVERRGREEDARNGRVGGYMNGDVWVNGSPGGGGGGGGGGGAAGFGAGVPTAGSYQWPTYEAPPFEDPGLFDPGPAFTYRDFVGPTAESMTQEPGFQFRIDQGRRALESSAAGKGVLRSGGTLKDILDYGQNFAAQEYGNVYNRALTEYDTNRNNAADIWGRQYGQRQDRYRSGADRAGAMNTFNTGNTQFGFNQRQRQSELDFADIFNRWQQEGNWLRDLGVAGLDS